MRLRRSDLPSLRAAVWTLRALRQIERELRLQGVRHAHVNPPPRLPASAGRGVLAVLRRRDSTCLQRALILQRWEAAHGRSRDVVIGVQGPAGSFKAHAWLAGSSDPLAPEYHELLRLPARAER